MRNRDIILIPTPSSDPGKFTHVLTAIVTRKRLRTSLTKLQMIHSTGRHDGNCSRSPV
jgi:hypothetical protein